MKDQSRKNIKSNIEKAKKNKDAIEFTVKVKGLIRYPSINDVGISDETQKNLVKFAIENGKTISDMNPIQYALISGVGIDEETQNIAVEKRLVSALSYFNGWDKKIKFVNELAAKNSSKVPFSQSDHEEIANFAIANNLDVNGKRPVEYALDRGINVVTSRILGNFFYSLRRWQEQQSFLEKWAVSSVEFNGMNAFKFAESQNFKINSLPFFEDCIKDWVNDDLRLKATHYAYNKIHEIIGKLESSKSQEDRDKIYQAALKGIESANKRIEQCITIKSSYRATENIGEEEKNSVNKSIEKCRGHSNIFDNMTTMLKYNNKFEKNNTFDDKELTNWAKASYSSTFDQSAEANRVTLKITDYFEKYPESVKGVFENLVKEYRNPRISERMKQACAKAYNGIAKLQRKEKEGKKQYPQLRELLGMTPQRTLFYLQMKYSFNNDDKNNMSLTSLIDIDSVIKDLLPNTIEVVSKLWDINEAIQFSKDNSIIYSLMNYLIEAVKVAVKTVYEELEGEIYPESDIISDLYKYIETEEITDNLTKIDKSDSIDKKIIAQESQFVQTVDRLGTEAKEKTTGQVKVEQIKPSLTDLINEAAREKAEAIKGMKSVINRAVELREKMDDGQEPVYWALSNNLPILQWMKNDEVFNKNVMNYLKDNPKYVEPIIKKIGETSEKLSKTEQQNNDKTYAEIIVDLNDCQTKISSFVEKVGGPKDLNKSRAEIEEEKKDMSVGAILGRL